MRIKRLCGILLLIGVMISCSGCQPFGDTVALMFGKAKETKSVSETMEETAEKFIESSGMAEGYTMGSSNANTQINQSANSITDAAKNTLTAFYKAIEEKRFDDSYNMLSETLQNYLGTLENYKAGYKNTISNSLSNINVTSSSADKATLTYTLTAKDRTDTGIMTQEFSGEAHLVKNGGKWIIDDMNVKKK